MVIPCQGNNLSGGGHSILHRVSDVRGYAPADRVLEGLETEARESKKGLWADPAPIPPWVYRKARRGQAPEWLDMEARALRVDGWGSHPVIDMEVVPSLSAERVITVQVVWVHTDDLPPAVRPPVQFAHADKPIGVTMRVSGAGGRYPSALCGRCVLY